MKFPNLKLYERKNNGEYNFCINILLLNDDLAKKKDDIVKFLIKKKIFVRSSWELIHSVRYFNKCPKMDLSNSKKLYNKIINLPSSPKYAL
jgi:dTDP-4-amino-4,6-dideoxygalactose transaminase